MNVNPTYAEVGYFNDRKATISSRHLSPCLNVNNKFVNCDETLESDVTKNDSNVAVDSGKSINEPYCRKNFKENNIISLKQNVR